MLVGFGMQADWPTTVRLVARSLCPPHPTSTKPDSRALDFVSLRCATRGGGHTLYVVDIGLPFS